MPHQSVMTQCLLKKLVILVRTAITIKGIYYIAVSQSVIWLVSQAGSQKSARQSGSWLGSQSLTWSVSHTASPPVSESVSQSVYQSVS